MKKQSLCALAAAGLLVGGLSVTSASAADLGGNCCADLEERIAELEATTARKGNRKVSLTVSGWVAQQVMWWDDGVESNTYVGDIGTTLASNVKFTGQATIIPGWTAGYVLHLEMSNNDSLALNQDYQRPGLVGDWTKVTPLQSYWFLKSESLGKISVGRQSQASDNTAILVDGSGSLV
ncbi:porin, partial [Hyphomicrobium sp.]|uniref:porin n=1 Tax=Hyphomicrobium sp. TaxID=82 RepID=UPI002FDCD129